MAQKAKVSAKKSNVPAEIGVGVAAAALAVAGGYVLWEKMGKQRQAKVKTWVAKARKEAAQKLAKAKNMGEAEYNRIVDAAVKRYGLSEGIGNADLAKVASDLKSQWGNIQKQAMVIANHVQKTRGTLKTKPKAKKATSSSKAKKTVAKKRKATK
jgi:hypothetical protein